MASPAPVLLRVSRMLSSKSASIVSWLLILFLHIGLAPLSLANSPLAVLDHEMFRTLGFPPLPNSDVPSPIHLELDALRVLRNHLMLKDFSQLGKALDALQIQAQDDPRLERRVREAYLGIDDEGESFYHEWLESNPYSYQANLAMASHYWSVGREARGTRYSANTSDEQMQEMKEYHLKALSYVDRAIKLRRDCRAAYALKISLLMTIGDENEKHALINETLRQFPDSTVLADAYMRALLPRWGGSYEQMKAIADIKVRHSRIPYEFYYLYGWILIDIANLKQADEQHELAALILQAAHLYGESLPFYYNASRLAYYGFNDYDLTEKLARQFIALSPSIFNGYLMLAKAHAKRENHSEALDALARARVVSNDIAIRNWRKKQARRLGGKALNFGVRDAERSRQYMTLAEGFAPTYPVLNAYRGVIKAAQGNRPAGWLDIEKAMNKAPNDFEVFRMMDYYWAMEGRFAQIIPYWTAFLARNPSHVRALHERAGTYYHMGRFRLALKDARQACDLKLEDACVFAKELQARVR